MAKTRQIKRRIKAVSNIERITKTMQMIATARFQAALRCVTQSQAYAQKIGELVGELASALGGGDGAQVSHPLLRTSSSEGGRQLLLVITSQRGLCGGYNANVLRAAMAFLRRHDQGSVDLEVVGKKGVAFFRFNQVPVATNHSQFTDKPQFDQVEQLAKHYMDAFIDGTYDAVHVAYMTFQSVARQSAAVEPLLPLSDPSAAAGAPGSPKVPAPIVDYDFSPDPKTLLDALLPVTVKTQLFQRFNEAILGEHIARMIAMKNATDSAGKMRKQLNLKFNRARQAAITTELSEIISGSAALE